MGNLKEAHKDLYQVKCLDPDNNKEAVEMMFRVAEELSNGKSAKNMSFGEKEETLKGEKEEEKEASPVNQNDSEDKEP